MDKRIKRKNTEGIPENKKNAVRSMLQDGKTYREIADILDVSKSTVGNIAKENAIDALDASVTKKGRGKTNVVQDLERINEKGRARLHEILDAGKTTAIETMAIVDKTFQHINILKGGTVGPEGLSVLVIGVHKALRESLKSANGHSGGNTDAIDVEIVK